MIDISHKDSTFRTAIAEANVRTSKAETVEMLKNLQVPKGNVLESARVAGLYGVKNTSNIIPDCHPLPIEFAEVRFEVDDFLIRCEMEVHTHYKTGVEVEAMHGVSVVALTVYDMLKPIDKGIQIESIRLLKKTGGKTDIDQQK